MDNGGPARPRRKGHLRVGLVLGGGGVVGLAYHAAALSAMENDLCWDPASADVIVGTSAGSLAGTLVRAGARPLDLAGVSAGAEVETLPLGLVEALRAESDFPPFSPLALVRWPRAPNVDLIANWLRRPWRVDPLGAIVSVLPDGELDLSAHVGPFAAAIGDGWPDDDLWICAVRQRDLRRQVFGRDLRPPLTTATLASCAIPGYFQPVVIDGDRYVDGGVRSPTNADVLRHRDLDLVIVVSPMSGRDLGRRSAQELMRRHARRKLEGEIAVLERAGIPTVVVEPGREVIEALGRDFMSREHLAEITQLAFLDTGEQLRAPFVRTLLGGLNGRAAAPAGRHDLSA
jgi:NTE family protein